MPTLTDARTVILSDALNHASIVDAIRLAKPARKAVYPHSDMAALRFQIEACEPGQRKLVITDGVFSMEGDIARLPEIIELAERYDALVIVDDSHAVGVLGETGRGTAEHYGLLGAVDVVTGTLGKALGGAAGGYVAASSEICELLAQRSRPQLFSNALPATVACSALRAVELLRDDPSLVTRLRANTTRFRGLLEQAGFRPIPGDAAIIPIVLGETSVAIRFSERLLDHGVFVTGFGFPVVPEGTARVRVQMSASLERQHLDRALEAFVTVGREFDLIGV